MAEYRKDVELEGSFSDIINDPAFKKGKKSAKGMNVFAKYSFMDICLGLSLLMLLLFPVLGIFLSGLSFYSGLILGGIAALLFWALSFVKLDNLSLPFKKKVKNIDGQVVKKSIRRQRGEYGEEIHFIVTIQPDKGKKSIILDCGEDRALYDYYRAGDIVRFHGNFEFPEKFHKKGDYKVICINCGALNYKDEDTCFDCALPLLK